MRVVTVGHKGKPKSKLTVYTAATVGKQGKYHQHMNPSWQTRRPEVAVNITSALAEDQSTYTFMQKP